MTSPDPEMDRAVRRTPPRQLQRVLVGYLASALAVLCGLPALVIGLLVAQNCTADGFACLGYGILGFLAAVVIAVIALPLISWRLRIGLWFALLTIGLVAAPLVLSGGSSTFSGTAFLAPGLAAWVSEPREVADPNPLAPPAAPTTAVQHWGPRFAAVLVISILVPLLGRVF